MATAHNPSNLNCVRVERSREPCCGQTFHDYARNVARGELTQQFLLQLLGHFLDILGWPAGDVHAKAQTHGRQNFLDLVQRLATEIRRAQHLRSEEHTSELQSLMRISYAVFCLKKIKYIPPK